MRKHDVFYVQCMLDFSNKVLARANDRSREAFDIDEDFALIIERLVEKIGEAARCVSYELRETHPEVRWKEIVGVRHRLAHDYTNVDYDVLWEIVTRDLPVLVRQLDEIHEQLSECL